ncbi:hypothetical protein M407DRAFT_244809 [Tulasnella calospora MUT 4182]|uniref:Uncharacterized protein n=1 Tax=Tulasnella calospora MUT 4182 TaxID=1051891 RepID=A0A0C3Q3Q6_9AGAM|nr:hypothetical protein M407DRAFT_244809 [Tulasnella calospora MUT 4182]
MLTLFRDCYHSASEVKKCSTGYRPDDNRGKNLEGRMQCSTSMRDGTKQTRRASCRSIVVLTRS